MTDNAKHLGVAGAPDEPPSGRANTRSKKKINGWIWFAAGIAAFFVGLCLFVDCWPPTQPNQAREPWRLEVALSSDQTGNVWRWFDLSSAPTLPDQTKLKAILGNRELPDGDYRFSVDKESRARLQVRETAWDGASSPKLKVEVSGYPPATCATSTIPTAPVITTPIRFAGSAAIEVKDTALTSATKQWVRKQCQELKLEQGTKLVLWGRPTSFAFTKQHGGTFDNAKAMWSNRMHDPIIDDATGIATFSVQPTLDDLLAPTQPLHVVSNGDTLETLSLAIERHPIIEKNASLLGTDTINPIDLDSIEIPANKEEMAWTELSTIETELGPGLYWMACDIQSLDGRLIDFQIGNGLRFEFSGNGGTSGSVYFCDNSGEPRFRTSDDWDQPLHPSDPIQEGEVDTAKRDRLRISLFDVPSFVQANQWFQIELGIAITERHHKGHTYLRYNGVLALVNLNPQAIQVGPEAMIWWFEWNSFIRGDKIRSRIGATVKSVTIRQLRSFFLPQK